MQSNLSAGYLLCLDQELDDLPFELAAGWFAADICEVKRHARTGLQQPRAAKVAVRPLSGFRARWAPLEDVLIFLTDWIFIVRKSEFRRRGVLPVPPRLDGSARTSRA
jgi:hypothetical protein